LVIEGERARLVSWAENLLLNLGAAVLLVVPIELFGSNLRRRVDAVDERQSRAVEDARAEAGESLRELGQKVNELDTKVAASLDEMHERVSGAMFERQKNDELRFSALASEAPSRELVVDALKRAAKRGLISQRGVRVPAGASGEAYISFNMSDVLGLEIVLQEMDGSPLRTWQWGAGLSAEELLEDVSLALDIAQVSYPLDTRLVFTRLSETLLVAAKHIDARPVVQYCPPQWAVTDDMIYAFDQSYGVQHDRLDRLEMDRQVKSKVWLDFDSYWAAFVAADALFPLTDRQQAFEAKRSATEGGNVL